MNEELFTEQITKLFSKRPDVFCGIGDDAAVLDLGLGSILLLAAADQVVEGIHYLPGTAPEAVARKLLNRNLSDIAAMGGVPTHAMVTLSLNPPDSEWLRRFHEGLEDCAKQNQVSVIGGDLASAPHPGCCASLSILGTVERSKLCLRSNGKVGDILYCTGKLGNSFASGHHLTFEPRLAAARHLAGRYTHTMMDLSDGLYKDAKRLAAASGLALEFLPFETFPLNEGADIQSALYDGEDYELLFAVPPEKTEMLQRDEFFGSVPPVPVGILRDGSAGTVLNLSDQFENKGYDHFYEN